MRIRRGYVDTSAGQLHWREAGADPPRQPATERTPARTTERALERSIVLLHWTPASGRQYEAVLVELARRGWRALAPDLMGYGRSDPRAGQWRVEDFAANLAEALAALGADGAPVVAGHFSALVAVELALRDDARVPALVLDGVPLWPAQVRERIARFVAAAPPAVTADGAHRTLPWDRVLAFVREWRPGFEPRDADLPWLYGLVADYLETRFASSAHALASYDAAARLPRLRLPVALLTADGDPLRDGHERALALVPGARGLQFAGQHPLHEPARAAEYVDALERALHHPEEPRR